MIIGIDISRANHTNRTGVEWYAFHLLEEFKKNIPSTIGVRLYSNEPLIEDIAKDIPSHWEVKILHWPPKRFWTQIRLSLEMLFHPPDVLFIPAHVFPLIHPRKTVMTVHDLAAIRFPETYNWFERWYTVWSATVAAKRLWKVIVPSDFTKRELQSVISSSSLQNVFVVPHGFGNRFINAGGDVEATKKKAGITKPYLFFVGRLEEKKNVVRIVKAFDSLKKVHDLQLVLAGTPGYGYEKVEQAIAESPYRSDIVLPGYVAKDELPLLMKGATVFVFPSLLEGFGFPVLEAFASRVPVVTSNGSSLCEVAGDAAVLVDPLDEDSLVGGIEKMLVDPTLREVCIQKGTIQMQRFSWETSAKETLQILLGSV